jgi:hypothetical protein
MTSTTSTARADLGKAVAAPIVAGAGFVLEGVLAVVHPVGDSGWDLLAEVLNVAFLVAVLAAALTLPTVARWLGVRQVGRGAVVVAQVGCVAMAVESAVSAVHRGSTLGVLFLGGVLLVALGLLALGITGLLAGVVRWAAPLPLLGWLVTIGGGDHGGSVVLGLLCFAYALLGARTTSEPVAA